MRWLWALCALLSGCWSGTIYRDAKPGEAITEDEVVLFGRVVFDPPIDPSERRGRMRDPTGRCSRPGCSFRTIRTSSTSIDLAAATNAFLPSPGSPSPSLRQAGREIQPGDRFVYIGDIVCRHQLGTPYEMFVVDGMEDMRAFWTKYTGGVSPAKRIVNVGRSRIELPVGLDEANATEK